MKLLTAYFSHSGMNYTPGGMVELKVGNTEVAARQVAKLCGCELFEICTAEGYPFDYRECVEVAKREMAEDARPELAAAPPDTSSYDALILCYPCWCGTMPMPVWTFLEGCKLSGKRILPLCTNEGSGMGRSEADIRRLCPEAEVEDGLSVRGSKVKDSAPEIEAWLKFHGVI